MLAVVFASGVLLGVAGDGNLVAAESEGKKQRMYEQVGPTNDQMVFIDSIVKDHRARMDALHEEFRRAYYPIYRELIEDTRGAIMEVFSDEQAAEYEVLLDDFDQRKAAERKEKEDRD
jgi:hypothetical protein